MEILPITEIEFDFPSHGHDMANAAPKTGMDYGDFLQRIVDAAVARYERS